MQKHDPTIKPDTTVLGREMIYVQFLKDQDDTLKNKILISRSKDRAKTYEISIPKGCYGHGRKKAYETTFVNLIREGFTFREDDDVAVSFFVDLIESSAKANLPFKDLMVLHKTYPASIPVGLLMRIAFRRDATGCSGSDIRNITQVAQIGGLYRSIRNSDISGASYWLLRQIMVPSRWGASGSGWEKILFRPDEETVFPTLEKSRHCMGFRTAFSSEAEILMYLLADGVKITLSPENARSLIGCAMLENGENLLDELVMILRASRNSLHLKDAKGNNAIWNDLPPIRVPRPDTKDTSQAHWCLYQAWCIVEAGEYIMALRCIERAGSAPRRSLRIRSPRGSDISRRAGGARTVSDISDERYLTQIINNPHHRDHGRIELTPDHYRYLIPPHRRVIETVMLVRQSASTREDQTEKASVWILLPNELLFLIFSFIIYVGKDSRL